MSDRASTTRLLERVDALRGQVGEGFRDAMVTTLYDEAQRLATGAVKVEGGRRGKEYGRWLDGFLTHPVFGMPLMLLMLMVVFWLTVMGANVPSAFLAGVLMEPGGLTGFFAEHFGSEAPGFLSVSVYEILNGGFEWAGAPAWIQGLLIDGVYLCLAWVVSVMLPPMAIFFPMFTLLEDSGYLPRVAFNLDWLFRRAGGHGKQALTMSMGFGCNAAGLVACRIIDSPREKLLAILTNNFMICNGRFPTVIAIAAVLVSSSVSAGLVSLVAALIVVAVVMLGVLFTFLVSWALTKTVLKGEPSMFTLELPPYRRPAFLRVIYTSLIDRTIFVLWRACVVAIPAGAVIWIVGNVSVGGMTVAQHLTEFLDPVGWVMGLDGVIILAYVIAIPANEIVMPTILMLYLQKGRMLEVGGAEFAAILSGQGWTTMTAVCLLLFCLLHNPCGTTIWTMWKETRSAKWTVFGALMPVVIGVVVCAMVAGVWRVVS